MIADPSCRSHSPKELAGKGGYDAAEHGPARVGLERLAALAAEIARGPEELEGLGEN